MPIRLRPSNSSGQAQGKIYEINFGTARHRQEAYLLLMHAEYGRILVNHRSNVNCKIDFKHRISILRYEGLCSSFRVSQTGVFPIDFRYIGEGIILSG